MADAMQDDILTPLALASVRAECLQRDIDPAERYPGASLETAMHAVLPHPVVLHVHCVNTIAWAVRGDAAGQLQERLCGLHWQWVPYVASGLPLARAVQKCLAGDSNVFVLGNHGLVIAGENCAAAENLLNEVSRRLGICVRQAHPADYTMLAEISEGSPWDLPDDDRVHALATDPISQTILRGGLLYPCQAIFANASTSAPFHSRCRVPMPRDQWTAQYRDRPFLIIEGRGVLVSRSLSVADHAMISGLAQVVQRIPASAPLRYLTEAEIASASGTVAYHYRELANDRPGGARGTRAASQVAQERSLAS